MIERLTRKGAHVTSIKMLCFLQGAMKAPARVKYPVNDTDPVTDTSYKFHIQLRFYFQMPPIVLINFNRFYFADLRCRLVDTLPYLVMRHAAFRTYKYIKIL